MNPSQHTLCLAVATWCWSCATAAPAPDPQPLTVSIEVSGPIGELKTVRPIVTLDGRELKRFVPAALDLKTGLTSFTLSLDPGTRGKLSVQVQAIGDDALLSDSAQIAVTLDADKTYALTLALTPVDYCGTDAWCWERPKKLGTIFTDIWGTAADDLWVVGMSGRPLHYDGFAFSEVPLIDDNAGTPTEILTPIFTGVHGSSTTDVWVVSHGQSGRGMRRALWRFEGSAFRAVYTGDVIVSGDSLPAFTSVWVSPRYVWAGGLRFANRPGPQQPEPSTLPPNVIFNRILAPDPTKPDDLWAAGIQYPTAAIWHWDEATTSWNAESIDPTGINTFGFHHLWGTSADNLVASAAQGYIWFQRQGTSWKKSSSSSGIVYTGNTATDQWLISGGIGTGQSGDLKRWDGNLSNNAQKVIGLPRGLGITRMFAPPGDPQSPLFLVGEGGVIHQFDRKRGKLTTLLKGVSANPATLRDIYGFSPNDVWAVGDEGTITHYDGVKWQDLKKVTLNHLKRLWGISVSEIWAVGDAGTIVQIVNGQPRVVSSGTTENLSSVWGVNATQVYAVGANATVLEWNGSTWSKNTATNAKGTLSAVWASGDRGVWIGGNNAGSLSLTRYDGTSWAPVSIPMPSQGPNVVNIRGSSSNNVLVSVNGGLSKCILRFDGSSWSNINPAEPQVANGIATFGADSIYSVGEETQIYIAGKKPPGLMPGPRYLYGLWGSSAKDLWTVGELGSVLHRNPKAMSADPS